MILLNYLVVAAIIFCIGLATVVVQRNAIRVLMGIELMLNAVNINLVAINYFRPEADGSAAHLSGQLFAVFVMTVAAAEAAVGLAIILALYRNMRTINVDRVTVLKH